MRDKNKRHSEVGFSKLIIPKGVSFCCAVESERTQSVKGFLQRNKKIPRMATSKGFSFFGMGTWGDWLASRGFRHKTNASQRGFF